MTAGPSTCAPPPAKVSIGKAALDAGMWALVALGLAFPIILFRSDRDISNSLVLHARPLAFFGTGLVVFAARFAWLLTRHRPRPKITFPPLAAPIDSNWLTRAGLAALLIFPAVALLLAGPSGAIKWVDNFGVQILI